MTFQGQNAFDNPGLMQENGNTCTLYSNLVVKGTVTSDGEVGAVTLPNNTALKSENAAGSGTLDLIKADASNNTIVNALTGKKIGLDINNAEIAKVDANGVTGTHFLLTDGSDKNYNLEAYATGTVYSLTNTSAAITFGTTQPALTINKAGTYLLFGRVNLKYNGATFAATRAVTLKLRRTNNTPADVTNSSTVLATAVTTTVTATFVTVDLAPVLYTTAVATDAVTLFADVAVVPTAGTLDAVEASIVAVRVY